MCVRAWVVVVRTYRVRVMAGSTRTPGIPVATVPVGSVKLNFPFAFLVKKSPRNFRHPPSMAVCVADPGVIAVFKAVTGGNLEDLQRLLCGADVNKPRFLTFAEGISRLYAGRNPKKFPGGTCLHVEAWKGHEHVVMAIAEGANINILDAYDRTPSAVASTLLRTIKVVKPPGSCLLLTSTNTPMVISMPLLRVLIVAPRNMKREVHRPQFYELCPNYFESSTGLEKMLKRSVVMIMSVP